MKIFISLQRKNMKKYKIAVYAISKNEEKFVDRWYESMKEADNIYVLDTGSTDNTVKKGIPWSDMGEELKDLTESINDKIDLFLADQFGSELRYEDICNSIGKEYIALESLWTVQEAYQKIILLDY